MTIRESQSSYAGTRELEELMAAFARDRWMPEEQTIARRDPRDVPRRSICISILSSGRDAATPTGWRWTLEVACLTPRSRGALKLASADPAGQPLIDHRYLSDPGDEDLHVLLDGVALAREIAAKPALSRLVGTELYPAAPSRPAMRWRRSSGRTACTTTIRWGRAGWDAASNRSAVVDSRGRIHGLDNAYVADASVMPVIPRANTNVPALVVGERIARWLLERS